VGGEEKGGDSVTLTLVPQQLTLPGMEKAAPAAALVFYRDPAEWTKANVKERVENALSYLEYQASKFRRDRFSADRWWYLNGIRKLNEVFFACPTVSGIELASPRLNASPAPSPLIEKLAMLPRPELVARLLAADPLLTDKRLLLRLARPKLAAMLVRAVEAAPRQERRRA
jgi:hypothetical protein